MCKQTQWAVALLLALFCASSSWAQTAGRISGTVKDTTGARLPNASVVIRDEATGAERSATANEDGDYVVTNLAPGLYSVSVEQQGFKRFVKSGVVLNADARVTVDGTLETGAVTDTVTVVAEAGETVNTTSGEIARVIDGEQVTNLALNARNFTQLATLIPGAPLLDFDAISAATNPGQGNLSINGNRAEANNLTVDGGFNLSKANANLLYNNIGIDFIQEVKVQASNFSAEHGRQGGAAINVTTRSGTNQLHGSAFEFFRNDQLDARNFFSTTVRKLRFNDFGGGIGGPIIKNKFFFFGGLEWKLIRRSFDPVRRTLPTRAELNGDFSFRLRGTDGIVGTADDGALRDPLKTGTCSTTVRTACFPGNIIPTDRLTADGRALAAMYRNIIGRIAQYTDTPTTNNATEERNNRFNYRQELLRLDYKFNDRHTLFGRYLRDWFDDTDATLVYDLRVTRRNPSLIVGHTWSLRPTLINDLRANFSQSRTLEAPQGDLYKRETYGLSYRQLYDDGLYPNGIPTVSVVGFVGFTGTSNHLRYNQRDFTISDNLTWVKSRHTLKTGILFLYPINSQQGRASAANIPNGTIAFNATGNTVSTTNALADMLLGNFRQYNESAQPPYTSFISKGIEAYVSDQWKVSSRLSFELGVRYQYLGATYTAENAITNFDPALYNPAQAVTVNPNGTLVPNTGNPYNGLVRAKGEVGNPAPINPALIPADLPRSLYDSPHRIGPRISFAYAPFSDNKTAIRGGAGVFYNNVRSALTQQTGDNPPFNASAQFENQNLTNINRSTPLPLGTVVTFQPDFTVPYTVNYSLSVQRELPGGIFAEVAYVGNQSRHLTRNPDINQPSFEALRANAALPAANRASTNFLCPYKGYSSIFQWRSDSNSNYNAVQAYVTKRKGRVVFTQSYTFGKALTDASATTENPENFFDRKYNYGPASFDRRHISTTTYTYTVRKLFKGSGAAAFGNALFADWELSGITRFQSGGRFTVSGNSSIGTRRADYTGATIDLPSDGRGVDRWFNTTAFVVPPEDRRGNSAPRMVLGPSLQLWDMSVRKRFTLRENWRLQFQGDFFNLFNKANFTGLASDVSGASYGTLTSAAPGRNIQLALKLTF